MTLHSFPANAVRRRQSDPTGKPTVGDRVTLPGGETGTILTTCADGRALVQTSTARVVTNRDQLAHLALQVPA